MAVWKFYKISQRGDSEDNTDTQPSRFLLKENVPPRKVRHCYVFVWFNNTLFMSFLHTVNKPYVYKSDIIQIEVIK